MRSLADRTNSSGFARPGARACGAKTCAGSDADAAVTGFIFYGAWYKVLTAAAVVGELLSFPVELQRRLLFADIRKHHSKVADAERRALRAELLRAADVAQATNDGSTALDPGTGGVHLVWDWNVDLGDASVPHAGLGHSYAPPGNGCLDTGAECPVSLSVPNIHPLTLAE